MSARPLILLSNDDGVRAHGVRVLHDALASFADLVVVAPLTEQSANSHALTLARPLRHQIVEGFHAIDGTPADCIYVGLYWRELTSRVPDLVVSGINHGYNLGSDTFYSGTVAAAREGALRRIPAIAFSLGMGGGSSFERVAPWARAITQRILGALPPTSGPHAPLFNVNFPAGDRPPLGIRVTRLGHRRYADDVDVRRDPRGQQYFWIGGPNAFHDPSEGSDTEAVDRGLASITPLGLDATDPARFSLLTQALEGLDPEPERR